MAVETSSRRGEVALVEHERVVAVRAFEAGIRHTAGLLPLIRDLLREHGWGPRAVEAVYVSVGPGGFMGTRIGVTFAKTFAFATGARIVAVPTPRVLLANLPAEADHALVVVDARRGKVWTQRYLRRSAEAQWRQGEEAMLTGLSERLGGVSRPVWLIGEGVAYHASELPTGVSDVHVVADCVPRAQAVAQVGVEMARRDQFTVAAALAPTYVRRPEAEEKRLGSG